MFNLKRNEAYFTNGRSHSTDFSPARCHTRGSRRAPVQTVRARSLLRSERARTARRRSDNRGAAARSPPIPVLRHCRRASRTLCVVERSLSALRHKLLARSACAGHQRVRRDCVLGSALPRRPRILPADTRRCGDCDGCHGCACLAQAYGLETDYFSTNRAPGGTFGNRNFVAHICVIGLPTLVWATVTARRPFSALLGCLGAAVVGAALVLSRSRAAWLALAASVVMLLVPMIASRKYWRGGLIGGRFARLSLAAVIGGMVAIVLPNTLNWNSDSPYLDSARGMVDYKKGSGRGRVAQYRNSLHMATSNPVFGVGPGNWPVQYVRFAPSNDRSLTDDGTTANPWPSSDWVAFISERGVIPTIALFGALVVLFFRALRRWDELENPDAVLAQCVLAGTIVGTLAVSAFDAVLLLAAP